MNTRLILFLGFVVLVMYLHSNYAIVPKAKLASVQVPTAPSQSYFYRAAMATPTPDNSWMWHSDRSNPLNEPAYPARRGKERSEGAPSFPDLAADMPPPSSPIFIPAATPSPTPRSFLDAVINLFTPVTIPAH
jgi:hypothetical protein